MLGEVLLVAKIEVVGGDIGKVRPFARTQENIAFEFFFAVGCGMVELCQEDMAGLRHTDLFVQNLRLS